MPKSTTPTGLLREIPNSYLEIPGYGKIVFNNLPDFTDSKNAVYNTEGIIGRSSPLHTYSYSDTRTISLTIHFYVIRKDDIKINLEDKMAIQSCLYPREGNGTTPFKPPTICKLRIGSLLAKDQDLCVALQQCSFKPQADVAWDEETLCPYKFDLETTWMVVYTSADLPFASRIIKSGR